MDNMENFVNLISGCGREEDLGQMITFSFAIECFGIHIEDVGKSDVNHMVSVKFTYHNNIELQESDIEDEYLLRIYNMIKGREETIPKQVKEFIIKYWIISDEYAYNEFISEDDINEFCKFYAKSDETVWTKEDYEEKREYVLDELTRMSDKMKKIREENEKYEEVI